MDNNNNDSNNTNNDNTDVNATTSITCEVDNEIHEMEQKLNLLKRKREQTLIEQCRIEYQNEILCNWNFLFQSKKTT